MEQRIIALKSQLENVELKEDSKDFLANVLEILSQMNEEFGAAKKDEIIGRINEYYEKRMAEIREGNTHIKFDDMSHTFTMFILPLDGFANKNYETQYDLQKINLSQNQVKFKPIYASEWTPGTNSEGLITSNKHSYTQIYRNGVVEVVDKGILSRSQIPSQGLENKIVEHVREIFELLSLAEVKGDFIIKIQIMDVDRVTLATNPERYWGRSKEVSGDISLPDAWITIEDDILQSLKIQFDALYSKFGFNRH